MLNRERRIMLSLMNSVDLKYHVDYDTIESSNCYEYGCDDEGICRCSIIERVEFPDNTEISLGELYQDFLSAYSKIFDLQNIVLANKLDGIKLDIKADDLEASWSYGYYGQEVDNITYNGPDLEIDKVISEVINASEKELLNEIGNLFSRDITEWKKAKVKISDFDLSDKFFISQFSDEVKMRLNASVIAFVKDNRLVLQTGHNIVKNLKSANKYKVNTLILL